MENGKWKLLIVEDNKSDSLPMEIFFKSKGWTVKITEFANEAINYIKKEKNSIDAIIIDIGLRDEEGHVDGDLNGGVKVVKDAKKILKGTLDHILILSARIEKGDKNWEEFKKLGVKVENIFQKYKKPSFLLDHIDKKGKGKGND